MKSRTSKKRSHDRILIAEDDEVIGRHVTDGLRRAGFHTHWVKDGVKAINWIFAAKPAAIVLDLALPRLSGLQICSMVRKTTNVSLTPIVVISGHTETEQKLKLFDLGADDYVTKPFSVDELIARLRAVLKRSVLLHPTVLIPAHVNR